MDLIACLTALIIRSKTPPRRGDAWWVLVPVHASIGRTRFNFRFIDLIRPCLVKKDPAKSTEQLVNGFMVSSKSIFGNLVIC